MRRLFPIRSLLLFTTLRLDTLLQGPFIYTCATRSLSYCSRTAILNRINVTSNILASQFSQIRSAKMSTFNADAKTQEVIDRLAEPASKEAEILEKNEGREAALKEIKTEEEKVEKKEEKKEEALPKLSAADFKVYNSMAEHMNYFVRPLLISTSHFHPFNPLLTPPISITISDNPGPFSTPPPPPTNAHETSLSANSYKPVSVSFPN